MVVFHVRGDRSEFLFETSVCTSNDSLIRSLYRVQNLRLRLAALSDALGGLGRFEERGGDEADSLGRHTGKGVSSQLRDVLARVAADARMVLDSKTQVARRVCMKERELLEKLRNIREAVTMAFPMGLPTQDPVKLMLDAEDAEKALAGSLAVLDVMPEDTAELWWAGKQFLRDQDVRDLAGENEKSTLLVQLQQKGGGTPSRKPGASEDERQAMVAFCFKKQQELQPAAEDDTGDYSISSWVDPKALKNSLRGTDSIRPF